MRNPNFDDVVSQILREDPRYRAPAYILIREALDFTIEDLKKPSRGPKRHVTGQELAQGLRRYLLQQYGPLSRTVLATWGIHRTEDFGEIVFHLVDKGILGRSAEDSKTDFAGGYDFQQAFVDPFLPAAVTRTRRTAPNNREKLTEDINHEA